jgi:hypothetical protein
MQANDRAELTQLVSDVLGYYRQQVSPFTLQVWLQAMQPFDMEQVRKAMSQHATDAERGQFAPKVADIVRILQGTVTDRAMLAWGKVHDAMGSVGAYTDVVFDDAVIHAVIEDLGGWPKCCRQPVDELSYLQHRFCEGYRAYASRGQFDYPKRLPGDRSADAEYEKRGLPPPKPAVVGDREKARLVYRAGGTGKAAISYVATKALALEYREAA